MIRLVALGDEDAIPKSHGPPHPLSVPRISNIAINRFNLIVDLLSARDDSTR